MLRSFFLIFLITALGFAGETSSPQCASNPLLGEWMDLSTLEIFRLNSDCSVSVQSGNCRFTGTYFPATGEQTEAALELQPHRDSPACSPLEKRSCQIQVLSSFFTRQCLAETPITYLKSEQLFGLSTELANQKETIIKFKTRPFSELEQHLKKLAAQKNHEAAAALGYLYFYGLHGFRVDYTQSLRFNEEASQFYTRSNTMLATHYLYGLGTESRFDKAEEYFNLSAKQDDVVAQKALAGMYLSHENHEQFHGLAIHWLKKAKELGDASAATFLQSLSGPVEQVIPRKPSAVEEPTQIAAESLTPVAPLFSPLNSLFYVSPFFLSQQNQGSQAALSVGVTPGVEFGDWAIRGHLSLSFLNLIYSNRFVGVETAIMGRYTQETDFLEFGTGLEFWPSPSGRALLLKVSYGRNFENLDIAGINIKSVALGVGNTFFSEGAFRIFVGAYF